jgi:phosphoribosylformylglycinamidine (FGAM) synthase-like amidotransferase family enzyme
MKKLFVLALAAMCVVGLASLSMAAEKAVSKNASHRMLGEVVSVDAAGHSFTIKETVKGGEAKEVTFNFDEKGKVMVAGKAAKLEDLKAGDSVTVRYTEKDGNKIAQELHVAKPSVAKTSKSK